METKWYSDFFELLVHPFSKGIDQIVQYGTLKKGFLTTIGLWLIPYLLLAIFGSLIASVMPRNSLAIAGLAGAMSGFFFISAWVSTVISSVIYTAIGSYVFSKVVNKILNGDCDTFSVMKINWYLEGYGVIFLTCVYVILAVLLAIVGSLFKSATLVGLIFILVMMIAAVIAIWVSLELMAREVSLSKLKVFIAYVITFIIMIVFAAVISGIIGGCASITR